MAAHGFNSHPRDSKVPEYSFCSLLFSGRRQQTTQPFMFVNCIFSPTWGLTVSMAFTSMGRGKERSFRQMISSFFPVSDKFGLCNP